MKVAEEVKERFERKYRLGHTPWKLSGVTEEIKKFVSLVKGKFGEVRLLDIGCGDGWLSVYFSKQGFKVSGIDSSKTAIERARGSARENKVAVSFKVGDALDFPYKDNSFNVVFDRGLFHHQPKSEWKRYLLGLRKVLQKDGLFYLVVFSDKSKTPKRRSKARLWQRVKDETGYWTYDHFFNLQLIKEIFGKWFELVEKGGDDKPQTGGSLTEYYILKKV